MRSASVAQAISWAEPEPGQHWGQIHDQRVPHSVSVPTFTVSTQFSTTSARRGAQVDTGERGSHTHLQRRHLRDEEDRPAGGVFLAPLLCPEEGWRPGVLYNANQG